ncbi:RNA polymerase sigma-70 factor (ECF subfamily) [Clostridium acetobutylicum]|uniref:Specialized sigma subunit of RNA polymerase n=1 Tax=Clostridium acetobutylicum (strain ATCC 824 / DSM 792 / JCM 1419 / IAM 19013 / LMG 5710 / NBRC 13948 / NRRL B-527 / VKM B-1787 / 2291 / W) TaxID=272562 RepID=Q97E49_CLOAB|nr:RNA polymerase sigma factor [Clostridium acetobutylicum]PSM05715.1 RNA polymerase sigma factor [Clostridium sp. NJ4]AAK81201.1 Specialized sigma subunit of RNA polymerase [Clostridium acetobutylicum ATCC 824]ADZ22306.1 Specialized sigma subunit of RNA polymerase [Clostridium acetobutylicum EA 2018]AEI32743.1 specialized sigma subunit of RNA polymerase [Clostridium acetobutylicum DSM 1731]AWV81129.1 RNA polymerase sigma factor [Clostridium acetobutylicum]
MEIDKEILKRCKKYDRASFSQLFHLYEKYLYNLCYGYTQNTSDAMDLVQEIYIKVFKNIKNFDENLPFHPWVRKISVNTCLNFKRDNRGNVMSLNSKYYDSEFEEEDRLAEDYNMEQEVVNRINNEVVKESIKKLTYDYRMVIMLRYYEDLSYDEIASVLDMPIGTVKTKIYRAKNVLKKSLEKKLEVKK